MIEQSKAKIFLAQERGRNETNVMRSYKTFNSGNFFNEHKNAFGNLCLLNDDTLAPGEKVKMFVEEEGYIIFLPIAGGILYNDSTGNAAAIMAGEAQVKHTLPGTVIEIENPYKDALVNYIQMRFRSDEQPFAEINEVVSFDIDNNKNHLVPIAKQNAGLPFGLYIAKVEGRSEIIYKLENKDNGVYAYVIEGAFEVQNRLLHERDGLALWEVSEIDAEALSNNAILLIAEISL
ncbi:MAG: hypothetical protein QM763_11925 [Agriterribacter sp.]